MLEPLLVLYIFSEEIMLSPVLDNVNDFKPSEIKPLIDKLCNTRSKNEPYLQEINKNNSTNEIFKMLQNPFFYCWITPHSIINKEEFTFKFNLYIDINDQFNGQSVYKYIFQTSYKKIEAIHTIGQQSRKHFPVQRFPIRMF